MLYNIEKKAVHKASDCITCRLFDKRLKQCKGINTICFVYDEKTGSVIDGVTKMPFIPNK